MAALSSRPLKVAFSQKCTFLKLVFTYWGTNMSQAYTICAFKVKKHTIFDSSIMCFEVSQLNGPFYIVAVDKNRYFGEKPGYCPVDVYASKCEVKLLSYPDLLMTFYFSQIYVDSLGGHREANRSECAFFVDGGYTTDYTIL